MKRLAYIFISSLVVLALAGTQAYSDEEDTRNILKQGLLGAGTGAIAAGTSGGSAGQGALIGAGTSIIGGALLDAITTPSSSSRSAPRSRPVRRSRAPMPQDDYYDQDEGEEYYEEEEPHQESGTQKVLKQGLLGAGTGAIAAGTSGGSAGKGALIGAGTNVIGSALLDAMTQPSQPKRTRVYRRPPPPPQQQPRKRYTSEDAATEAGDANSHKKVIKKYDDTGKLVSEEEIYY